MNHGRTIFLIFIHAFWLNLIWENLHSFLYFLPNGQVITEYILLRSTFLDALFIAFLGFIFLRSRYLQKHSWLIFVIGVVVAITVERFALAHGLWAYRDTMPVIPLVGTGLTPTIQLGLLGYLVIKRIDS